SSVESWSTHAPGYGRLRARRVQRQWESSEVTARLRRRIRSRGPAHDPLRRAQGLLSAKSHDLSTWARGPGTLFPRRGVLRRSLADSTTRKSCDDCRTEAEHSGRFALERLCLIGHVRSRRRVPTRGEAAHRQRRDQSSDTRGARRFRWLRAAHRRRRIAQTRWFEGTLESARASRDAVMLARRSDAIRKRGTDRQAEDIEPPERAVVHETHAMIPER